MSKGATQKNCFPSLKGNICFALRFTEKIFYGKCIRKFSMKYNKKDEYKIFNAICFREKNF